MGARFSQSSSLPQTLVDDPRKLNPTHRLTSFWRKLCFTDHRPLENDDGLGARRKTCFEY